MEYQMTPWHDYELETFIMHPRHSESLVQVELRLRLKDGPSFYAKGTALSEKDAMMLAMAEFNLAIKKAAEDAEVERLEQELGKALAKKNLASSFCTKYNIK